MKVQLLSYVVILGVVLCSSMTMTSQTIRGTVLDEDTHKPIAFVTVYLNKQATGTSTDEQGDFKLELSSHLKPKDSIQFSIIGYQTKTMTFSHFQVLESQVYLSKKTEALNEVVLTKNIQRAQQVPYKRLASLKHGVYHFGAVQHDDKIYVVGGDLSFIEETEKKVLDDVSRIPDATFEDYLKRMRTNFSWESYSDALQIYDLNQDTWTTCDVTFHKRAYHKTVYLNKNLYTLGGKTLSVNKKYEYLDPTIEILNLDNQELILDQTNPHQAINSAAMTYQDNIIVMGGSTKIKKNGDKEYSKQAHMYQTSSGYWYELPQMTEAKEVNGVVVQDMIYLIGGFHDTALSTIETYDLKLGVWKKEGDLFEGMSLPALATRNHMIYIYEDGQFLTYNTYSHVLNAYHIGIHIKGAMMFCHDNYLYLLGGYQEDEFTKSSTTNVLEINLNDLTRTSIQQSKILASESSD